MYYSEKSHFLRDEHRTYKDILVNPNRLRQDLVEKSSAAYLLNEVLDLIFTDQEFASKGVRSLDAHKMKAGNG